jgi:hypothetical protein
MRFASPRGRHNAGKHYRIDHLRSIATTCRLNAVRYFRSVRFAYGGGYSIRSAILQRSSGLQSIAADRNNQNWEWHDSRIYRWFRCHHLHQPQREYVHQERRPHAQRHGPMRILSMHGYGTLRRWLAAGVYRHIRHCPRCSRCPGACVRTAHHSDFAPQLRSRKASRSSEVTPVTTVQVDETGRSHRELDGSQMPGFHYLDCSINES